MKLDKQTLIFYEKPGCASHQKQKRWLYQAGIHFSVRNLLTYPWTAKSLQTFFDQEPVIRWFNPNAPKVKSGEVIVEKLSERAAIEFMLQDPLLIRRPLIECHAGKWAGFDPQRIARAMGIKQDLKQTNAHSSGNSSANIFSSIDYSFEDCAIEAKKNKRAKPCS